MSGQELEKAGKPVIEQGDLPSRMTAQKREAAWLDAQGLGAKEIAQTVGVHDGSISRWRTQSDYIAERERVQDMIHGRLDELVEKLKLSAVGAYDRAIGVFLDAMEAMDADGTTPLWSVRIRAAEAVVGQAAIKSLLDVKTEGESATALANAVVQVVIKHDGRADVTVGGEAEEIEDAEIEEA